MIIFWVYTAIRKGNYLISMVRRSSSGNGCCQDSTYKQQDWESYSFGMKEAVGSNCHTIVAHVDRVCCNDPLHPIFSAETEAKSGSESSNRYQWDPETNAKTGNHLRVIEMVPGNM